MRFKFFLTPLLLILAALFLPTSTPPPPPTPAPPETLAELTAALSSRLRAAPEAPSLTFSLFTPEVDTAFVAPDGQSAVVWLALRDRAGRRLAAEPGLALADRSTEGWQMLLPGDPGWEETLAALPEEMLPVELSPAPEGIAQDMAAAEALTGYYLPWAAGTKRWLEGSISHFQSIPELGYPSCSQAYCQYAYDFTDSWHFPLLASKAGTVVGSYDGCSDGSPSCTNYIVLRSADDGAYQIYLHLAHGTVPDKLAPGVFVQRGQYLGDTDDTGYSTSQHVHFMVTNSIWMSTKGYYWGYSVPIRFADVTINNGIPRNCYEVTHFPIYDGATECLGNRADPRNPANDWFTSGNVGAFPPWGTLSTPAAGATVAAGTGPIMDVTARIQDDVAVTAVRLLARLNGQWVEVGPKVTQAAQPGLYDWDVNLCSVGPLNGPLEVAVRAWDYEGNASGPIDPHTIQVDHACPPPSSQLKTAETFASTAVRLSWDAASAGAGFSAFELQWRTGTGSWSAANTLTISGSQRSAWFAGDPGKAYAFRLRALDSNGQPEPWPAGDAAEVTSAVLPGSCDPDSFEPDDSLEEARTLLLAEPAQGNLCPAGDAEWFQVEIAEPTSYLISSLSVSGGAAVSMTVYAADGTALASSAAPAPGRDTLLVFRPPAAGVYTIELAPLTANLFGTEAVYRVSIEERYFTYMPLTSR